MTGTRNRSGGVIINRFGKSSRSEFYGTKATPGPGSYETRTNRIEGPNYTLRGKFYADKDYVNSPGPGNYQPAVESTRPKSPNWM